MSAKCQTREAARPHRQFELREANEIAHQYGEETIPNSAWMPAFLLRHRRICQLNDGMSAGQSPVLTAEFHFPQLSFRPKFVSFELLVVLRNIQLATDKIRTGAKGRAAVIWKGQTAICRRMPGPFGEGFTETRGIRKSGPLGHLVYQKTRVFQ